MSSDKPAVGSPAGGKKAKKKAKPVSLNDFLNTKKPSGYSPAPNWADATEDIDPSDITTQWPDMHPPERHPNFDRSKLPSAPRASTAADIDMRRLPSRPPYTIYLGNLSYECSEEDIMQLFERKKLKAHSVRLPLETGTRRLRGFGYAEFDDINDLKEALLLKGETLLNRPIHIDIADGKSGGGGPDEMMRGDRRGRIGSDDRTDRDWRRSEENEPPEPDRDFRKSSDDYSRERGMDRDGRGYGSNYGSNYSRDDRGRGRDEWSDRGSFGGRRFGGGRYGDDRPGGYEGRRDGGFENRRDYEYDRRDSGYDSRRERGYEGRREGGFDGGYGRPRDDRYGGGHREYPPRRGYGDRYDDGRGYDRRGRDDYRGGPPLGGGDDGRQPLAERPRLLLQPRSKNLESPTNTNVDTTSSIFGEAKPVDTATREMEVEERLKRENENKELRKDREEKSTAAVFGAATPVDTAARDRMVEEKLLREKELLNQKLEEEGGRQRHPSEGDRSSDGDRRGSRGDSRERSQRRGGRGYSGRSSRDGYSDRERKPSDDRGGGPPDSDRSRRKGEGPSRARHSSGGGEGSDPPPRGKGVKDDHYQRTSDKSQERSARSTEEGEGHEEQRRADRSQERSDQDSVFHDDPVTSAVDKDTVPEKFSHKAAEDPSNVPGEGEWQSSQTRKRKEESRPDRGSSSSEGSGYRGREERGRGRGRDGGRFDSRRDDGRGDRGRRRDDRRGGGRGKGRGRGEAGGRREDDRQRNTDRDVESGGQKKAWGGNAWAKGKPSSLGGPEKIEILKRKVQVDSEPPNFAQKSRFAMLDAEEGEGGANRSGSSTPT